MCWTFMHHCKPVVVIKASTTYVSFPTKPDKLRGCVAVLSAGIVALARRQIDVPTGQFAVQLTTASRDHRADHIKEELYGDVKSTWRTAQRLLHSNSKVIHDDADCKKLASAFSRFFVDKTNKIQINIESALQSSARREFATRRHVGASATLSSF